MNNTDVIESQLNPNMTFESYCVGEEINKEFLIARSYTLTSSTQYPMVIIGQSGVGKTHLVNAIGNKFKEETPNANVLYITCLQFCNQLFDAVRKNCMSQFYNFYQSLDVLLMDDCQYISSRVSSQRCLQHIIEILNQKKAKMVFVFDSTPTELGEFDSKLLLRIKSGISIELQPASKLLRFQILESLNSRLNFGISSEYLQAISEAESSIFEMLGHFYTLRAYKKVMDEEIDISIMHKIIGYSSMCKM